MNTDKNAVIVGQTEWWEVEEGMGGINGKGKIQ